MYKRKRTFTLQALVAEYDQCYSKMTTYQVSVPETHDTVQWYLPHQQVVHPAKGKLQILDVIDFEMMMQVTCTQPHIFLSTVTHSS